MGTQTAIAEKIIDDGGDYILALAMKRRACGWNDEYLLQVLTGTRG